MSKGKRTGNRPAWKTAALRRAAMQRKRERKRKTRAMEAPLLKITRQLVRAGKFASEDDALVHEIDLSPAGSRRQ
jgi:hypothetical protein